MSAPLHAPMRSRFDAAPPYVLSLFRIVVGLLFTCHGASTLFGWFGGSPMGQPEVGAWPGWWAALIQFAGGILVLLGLGARGAAVICSGSMAYAYFTVHAGNALLPIQNGGEPSALFCWAFLLIAVFGPGSWSLGRLLRRNGYDSADGMPGAAESAAVETSTVSAA